MEIILEVGLLDSPFQKTELIDLSLIQYLLRVQ